MSKQTILIAEDEESIRELFSLNLRERGYNTILAGDGREAVDIAISEKPDLIILNYGMPIKTGFEAFIEIRKHPETKEIPILITSGSPERFIEFKDFETGKEDYIAYPCFLEELHEKIKVLLQK